MSRVLLVGDLSDDKWIGALIKHVKDKDPSLQIDFFWHSYSSKKTNVADKCECIYFTSRHFPSIIYKIPMIRLYFMKADIRRSFNDLLNKKIAESFQYDIINFHYLNNETLCFWSKIKRISKITFLMPWGSDVLRRTKRYCDKMAEYITHYDYIATSDNPRFKTQLITKLHIKESQFVQLDFGVTAIDLLNKYSSISRQESKHRLGLDDFYIITCGYNAHPAQNHIKIIEAINKVKSQLPNNILLVFPMTYGSDVQRTKVREKLDQFGIRGKIFDKYLSDEEIVYLRKCSEMFIHAQNTDSNSASLAEYLLCRTNVINASWLRYEHYEIFGKPFYSFDNFELLPETILKAYEGGSLVTDEIADYIKHFGWQYKVIKWVNIFNGVFVD